MARLYSVWDPRTLAWDYYQAAGQMRAGVFADEPKLPAGHRIGLTPEEAARPLPVGSVRVGSGPTPKGMIATRNRSALGFFGLEGDTLVRVAVVGALGYLAYRYLEERR